MKSFILYVAALFFLTPALAQEISSKKADSISAKVIHYLKNKQADSIYAMTGKTFREKITAENFGAIMKDKIFPLNNFERIKYISTKETINKYRIDTTPPLQMLIGLDADDKIQVFLIQEYTPD